LGLFFLGTYELNSIKKQYVTYVKNLASLLHVYSFWKDR